MKRLNILLLFLGLCSLSNTISKDQTTIFIVRHAEKDLSDPKNTDPGLSLEGVERAEDLVRELKRQKLSVVFSTRYKRTIQTASATAKRKGVHLEYYDPRNAKTIADLVNQKYKNQKVLIVGHSNTVLELLEAFGARRPIPSLTEADYDLLFIIRVGMDGKATLETRRYGRKHHVTELEK